MTTLRRAGVLLSAALLAACSAGAERDSEAAIAAVADEVEARASEHPGVTAAEVTYEDEVRPVTAYAVRLDTAALEDAALADLGLDLARTIWFSDLASVTTVFVEFQNEPGAVAVRLDDVTDVPSAVLDRADLEELFGPREG